MAYLFAVMNDAEIRYFYHGFAEQLRRTRTLVLIGWSAVVLSGAAVYLGWQWGRMHGLLDSLLAALAAAAGLGLVSQGVAALTAYLSVPYDRPADGAPPPPALAEILELMRSVDHGGWREAASATAALEEIARRHGLPPPPGGRRRL